MKKFLSVLLAVMMVLSAVATMIVSVSAAAATADATETPNSILVSDGSDAAEEFYNAAKPGWSLSNGGNGDNTYKVVDFVNDDKKDDKAVGEVITGPASSTIFAYRFHYWAKETLDISGMQYVEFDLYLSDASAYKDQTMIVELSSAGIDAEDIRFMAKYPLVDGWNHIRLNLDTNFVAKTGTFNEKAWKFARIWFPSEQSTFEVADGEEFTIMIDNLEFNNGLTNGGAEVAPHRVDLTNCDAVVDGWEWVGDGSVKATDDKDNTGAVAKTWLPGEKIAFAGIHNYFNMTLIEGIEQDYLDTTDAKKFVFEFYTSNASLVEDLKFVLELTSGGNCDKEEINWNDVTLGQFVEGGLKNGWNTVVLELTPEKVGMTASYRPNNWNYFRIYLNSFQDGSTLGVPEGLTLAFDNVRFEKEDGTAIVVSDCNPDKKGWDGSVGPMGVAKVTGTDEETGEDIKALQNVMGKTYTSNITGAGDMNFMYANPNKNGVNITGMKYLEFDFYISDADAFSNGSALNIELGSSFICDKSEIAYTIYSGDKSLGLKDGWNHVSIPLELFTEVTNGDTGAIQPTFINWFRFFNQGNIPVDGELTVAIDNISFWDGKEDLKTSGRGDILQGRETITQTTGATQFEFAVENADTAKGAVFTAQLGGRVEIQVSTDGENWEDVYKFADSKANNGLSNAVRAFTLTKYIVDEDGNLLGDTIYVKVAGNLGGSSVTLDVVYDIPEFEDTDNYTFTVGTAAETPYVAEPGSLNDAKSVRYADGNGKVVYKYDLSRTQNLEGAAWSVGIQGQYVVSASKDGTNWTEVLRWDGTEGGEHGPTTAVSKLIDLKAIDLTGTVESIYIMITDAVPSDGWGGAVTNTQPTTLSVKYFDAASMKHETTSFKPVSGDADYLSQNTANVTGNSDSRFADKNATFTYKYDVAKSVDGIKSITWSAAISAQYLVKASADGENWIEIGKNAAGADKAVVNFDASALVADVTKTRTIYIQIGDADPTGGNGGRVWADTAVVLDIAYIPLSDAQKDALEMAGDEHTVSLDGCNALWSNQDYTLDFENAIAGSACLSVDLKNGIVSQLKLENPVDATGMDTFEFDLYLSDLAILDDVSFHDGDSIEITSGGQPDKGEKAISFQKIFANLKDSGTAVQGWNHISVKITDMSSTDTSGNTPFDIASINFIRVFWVNATMPADSEKYTLKFDNFRLTDAEAQKTVQLAKDKAKFDADHADLVAELKALNNYNTSNSVTAENYEAVKAEIAAVKAKVAALTEKEQQIAADAGYIKYMEKAESSVEKYEKDLEKKAEAMEANKAVADAINALTTEITKDNYETVKAAVEAARADYDKLSRTHKGYFTEEGLTAKLEAAEAAVKAFKPDGETNCEHTDADTDGKCDKCGADMGTTTPAKKGCGGVLTVGAVATMVLAGAWVTMAARKRED